MANKETVEVWAGPGVLYLGRRKIKIGDEIPKELEDSARESLRDKGMIVDDVVKDKPDLKAIADNAVAEADKAEAAAEAAMDESVALTEKAEGSNKKADKEAAKAADDKAMELAEEATRLRLVADKAVAEANG